MDVFMLKPSSLSMLSSVTFEYLIKTGEDNKKVTSQSIHTLNGCSFINYPTDFNQSDFQFSPELYFNVSILYT